jgi:hypothetical protein
VLFAVSLESSPTVCLLELLLVTDGSRRSTDVACDFSIDVVFSPCTDVVFDASTVLYVPAPIVVLLEASVVTDFEPDSVLTSCVDSVPLDRTQPLSVSCHSPVPIALSVFAVPTFWLRRASMSFSALSLVAGLWMAARSSSPALIVLSSTPSRVLSSARRVASPWRSSRSSTSIWTESRCRRAWSSSV